MIIIRYLDIYDEYYDDEGQPVQELVRENFTLPTYMDITDIVNTSPFFSKKGKLFKNVSIIEDRYGKVHKVVGNYKEFKRMIETPTRKGIGYGK